jgi:uncharacterized protein
MLCPNCKTENLVTSERQSIQIDHCPRCQGVWLDRGELEKLIQLAAPQDERRPEGYNGRELGDDDEAPRRRGHSDSSREDDDDDDDDDRDDERGSYRSRDRGDDAPASERGGSYGNRQSEDQRGGSYGNRQSEDQSNPVTSAAKSILREIFDNLNNRMPRT